MSGGYQAPEWRVPPRRTGWNDPRFSQAQPTPPPQAQYQYHQQQQPPPPPSATSPISPINPQAFAYHPPDPNQAAGYGAPPTHTNQYDTSTWGVKYKQTHNQPQQWPPVDERPPLPPRPSSALPSPSAQQAVAADQWQQGYGSQAPDPHLQQGYQQGHQQQPSWSSSYNQQASYGQTIPPPPPPKPPVYEAQTQQQQYYQQQNVAPSHYSHQPPTHQYEPRPGPAAHSQQQYGLPQPQYSLHASIPGPPQDPAPVSPIESEPHKWPTQQPLHGHTQPSVMQAPATPGEDKFYSSALGPYGGPSDWEHFGDGSTVSPEVSSPPQAHSVPASAAPVASQSPPPMRPMTISPPPPIDHDRPTQPVPQGTDSSSVGTGSVKRTDTIDGVINAWTAPLKVGSRPPAQDGQRPQSSGSMQESPKERVVEVIKEVTKIVDPYDDLAPEVKASLKRYADMLRKEASAETDEQKFAAFEAFIKKELRLRAMLYGMDSPLQLIKNQDRSAPADSPGIQSSVAVPAAIEAGKDIKQPKENDIPSPTPAAAAPDSQPVIKPNFPEPATADVQPTAPPKSTNDGPNILAMAAQLKDSPVRDSPARDDAFVMVNPDEEEEYSPGGRPRPSKETQEAYSPGGRPIVPKTTRAGATKNEVPELSIPTATITNPGAMSPGANAPMVLEDYVMPGLPSPGANAPMLVETPTPTPPSASANAPIVVDPGMNGISSKRSSTASNKKFEPQRPAYTPFRYSPAVQGPSMPADKSYSSLRKDGMESQRFLKHESTPRSTPTPVSGLAPVAALQPGKRMQDEAFIGLIRQQSQAVRKGPKPTETPPPLPQLRPGTPARVATPAASARTPTPAAAIRPGTPAQPSDLQASMVSLRNVLPTSVPDSYGLSKNKKANEVKEKMDSIMDQFGFIHQTVLDWDKRNRVVRKRLDEDRSQRQADSEARIDDMFNDNEIGYADIGELEAEFKLAEAKLKYEEDKDELDSFTRDVFEVITGKLQHELSELDVQYKIAIELLDQQSEPAGRCLTQNADVAEMGIVMNLVLSIFNKMDVRHQKIVEATVERERRRKRLELTVLYTNGDTQGVKTLEAEFAVAEKMQVLHEARARDMRANELMDAFDRATVRGLGDNQTYIDDLLPKVSHVREFVFKDTAHPPELLYGPDGVRETLATAQKAIDFVLADSQKLLTISNVADKLLNDADYSVSVAEARVSDADRSTHQKLREEKEKEDAKIVEDTNSRMSAISKGPEEGVELIREVVARIGDDPEHQERIKRALEAAKQRNKDGAAEGSGGS